jgi:hypothetical protein
MNIKLIFDSSEAFLSPFFSGSMNNMGHIEITGIDVEKMMLRLMSMSMSDEASSILHENVAAQMKAATEASTREGLVEHFKNAREEAQKLAKKVREGNLSTVTTTQSYNVKPNAIATPQLKDCLPVTIQSMAINTTHRNRHLCGKVAVGDSFRQIRHVYFLLEDIRGDLVRVSVYNTNRTYRFGETMTILVPFYKVAADMIPMVRVDNPKEIVSWEAPETPTQWKESGDSFARAKDFKDALFCCQEGMNAGNLRRVRMEASTLLTNIALCDFKLGRMKSSIWCAGSAVFLEELCAKAWYRLIASLSEIDIEAAREVALVAPETPELKRLVTKLLRIPKKKNASTTSAGGLAAWSAIHPSWTLAPDFKPSSTFNLNSDWTERRNQARCQFESSNFESARELYILEMRSMWHGLKTLADLALGACAAHQSLEQDGLASVACAVSVLLDRTSPETWRRQANAIEVMQGASAAIDFLKRLMTEPEVPISIIAVCEQRIEELVVKQRHKNQVKAVRDCSTEKQLLERSKREYDTDTDDHDEYNASMEALIPMSRSMVLRLPPSETVFKLIQFISKRRAPSVDTEYPTHMGWPAGDTRKPGLVLLRKGYLNASSHPWMSAFQMALGHFQVDETTLLKRWHGPHRAMIFCERRDTLSVGDIVDLGPNDLVGYEPCLRSVFMNAPANPLADFRYGDVHVSIGFNDLGELLSLPQGRRGVAPDREEKRPLRFVGVDKSEYAVARCLVIRELLLDPDVPISVVFQVWYSAGWTNGALRNFRSACKRVLSCYRPYRGLNESTRSYLSCWLSDEPIAATESRTRFVTMDENRSSRLACESCSFRRLADRLAIVHYVLTGELIPRADDEQGSKSGSHPSTAHTRRKQKCRRGRPKQENREQADCGSMVFWNTPPNSPPLESEVFFHTVSLEALLENLETDTSSNVVDVMMRIKLDQLRRVREDLLDGRIQIDLICDVMDETNERLISELVALRPGSVSWSNLMDYWSGTLKSFHRVARHIGPSSRHFGYTMNWTTTLYGASMVDYLLEVERAVRPSLRSRLNRDPNLEKVRAILVEALQTNSDDKNHPLLYRPLFDNPLNLTGYVLAKQQCPAWIRHFEKESLFPSNEGAVNLRSTKDAENKKGKRSSAKVVAHCMLQENPLLRTISTLYLEWAYGEAL